MSQPFYNPTTGIRIDTGLNLDAQASSLSEIKRTMYSLCDSPENINLICESCTLEEADSFLNIGTTLIAEAVTAVYNRLDSKMSALVRVFKRYLPSNIKAMDYPSIGPDRKNGLFAYKTATFTFDDGQTVSILFHSPTADPKKFKPSETLIAYRWLLNKRDITAVVSPENGRDITLQVMAKRMMELVEANHDKFIAAQAKSDEQVKQLQELEANRDNLQEEVDSLTQNNADLATDIAAADKEIEKLIGKLEKMPMPAQAEAEPSPVSDEANLPAEPTKINPEPLPDVEVKTAPIEQPVTNTEELPLDELPEPVTEPESTKAEDTELPPAEPVKAEPQQSKSLYDLDNNLFKSIKKNLDIINNIDEGRESWDRPSFVNSITGKLKTRAKNGEADIVDAALFYIAGRNKTVAKDMILGRNSVWKLTGKDSAYYAKGANAIKVSGEVMPNNVPEENIATMLPIDITAINGSEILFTKDGLSYASLVDNPKDYKVGIMEMVEEQAEAAPQVMAGDEDAAASTDGNQATEELADMADDLLSGVPEPVMKSVIIQNGNKEVNVKVIGSSLWEKDDKKRVYFELKQDNKRVIFSKFFEVIAGEAKDSMTVFFEVNGRKFGYVGGMLDSKTKREAAFEGAKELAAAIAENSAASTDGNQATEELADMADDLLSGVPEPVETLLQSSESFTEEELTKIRQDKYIADIKDYISNGLGQDAKGATLSIKNKHLQTLIDFDGVPMRRKEIIDNEVALGSNIVTDNDGENRLEKSSGGLHLKELIQGNSTGYTYAKYIISKRATESESVTPPQTEPAASTENSADPLEQVRADLIALLSEADSTAALDTLERLMDEGEALGMDIDNDPDMLAASNHITQLLEGEQ